MTEADARDMHRLAVGAQGAEVPSGWKLVPNGSDEVVAISPTGERWLYRDVTGTGTDSEFIYPLLRALATPPSQASTEVAAEPASMRYTIEDMVMFRRDVASAIPEDTLDRLMLGKATEGDQLLVYNVLHDSKGPQHPQAAAVEPARVKVERTCPRCNTRAYHRGNDRGIANRIACVNCGHEWNGRITKDEQS